VRAGKWSEGADIRRLARASEPNVRPLLQRHHLRLSRPTDRLERISARLRLEGKPHRELTVSYRWTPVATYAYGRC